MSDSHLYTVNDVIRSLPHLHGQTIQIACALHMEFEGDFICHIPKTEQLPDYAFGLWADFDHESLGYGIEQIKQFNGRHVIVTATVDQTVKGHFGLWPGSVLIRSIVKQRKGIQQSGW